MNSWVQWVVNSPESRERFTVPGGCHKAEGDSETCNWCLDSFAEKYPLSAEDIQRCYFEGNPCLWTELVRKYDAGEVIHIAVIGTSMTAGHGCHDKSPGGCDWPARLERLFNSSNVVVHNYAVPAADYDHYLASGDLQSIECDLLLVDLAVNIQSYIQKPELLQSRVDAMIYTLLKTHPQRPLLWVTTYRSGGSHSSDVDSNCPNDRGSLTYSLTGNPHSHFWCWYYIRIKDHEEVVTSHYGIPVVSYRDAAWRGTREGGIMKVFDPPRENQVCFWNGWAHPYGAVHLLVADLTFYAIHGMLNKARELGSQGGTCEVVRTPLFQETSIPHMCSDIGFITHMTSNHPEGFKPTGMSSHWKFGEDVKGKAGWIIHAEGAPCDENYLTFNIEIGHGRTLETTYLRSYNKIGAVFAELKTADGNVAGSFYIDAWEQFGRISIPVTVQHKLYPEFEPGNFTVTYSLDRNAHYPKFKLISVSSC